MLRPQPAQPRLSFQPGDVRCSCMGCGVHMYVTLDMWPPRACTNCGGTTLLPVAAVAQSQAVA